MNFKPIFQAAPKTECITRDNADGTTSTALYTAGTDGGLVDSVSVVSTDTVAVILVLSVDNGTTECQIGEVSIPAGSGSDGSSPAKNLLDAVALPFLQSGGGLALGASAVLKVAAKVAVTATKQLDITAYGGDY